MATRKSARQVTMGFEDPPPPRDVQTKADIYVDTLLKANKAKGACNTAKDNIIAAMKEHGLQRLKVNNGAKMLELTVNEKVLLKKVKEPTAVIDDDDDE